MHEAYPCRHRTLNLLFSRFWLLLLWCMCVPLCGWAAKLLFFSPSFVFFFFFYPVTQNPRTRPADLLQICVCNIDCPPWSLVDSPPLQPLFLSVLSSLVVVLQYTHTHERTVQRSKTTTKKNCIVELLPLWLLPSVLPGVFFYFTPISFSLIYIYIVT